MIDLDAIKARIEEIDRLRREYSWIWPGVSDPIMMALDDRKELVEEVERLRLRPAVWRPDILSNDCVAYRARIEKLGKQLEQEEGREEG